MSNTKNMTDSVVFSSKQLLSWQIKLSNINGFDPGDTELISSIQSEMNEVLKTTFVINDKPKYTPFPAQAAKPTAPEETTLRDLFASRAMSLKLGPTGSNSSFEEHAKNCWLMADEMLRTRNLE